MGITRWTDVMTGRFLDRDELALLRRRLAICTRRMPISSKTSSTRWPPSASPRALSSHSPPPELAAGGRERRASPLTARIDRAHRPASRENVGFEAIAAWGNPIGSAMHMCDTPRYDRR